MTPLVLGSCLYFCTIENGGLRQMYKNTDTTPIEPKSVCKTFRKYQQDQVVDSMDETRNDSKLYLLIRVVFYLPEHAPKEEKWSYFGHWLRFQTEYNSDGTINQAWPIMWNKGNPCLISGCLGIQGFGRYSAADEFLYLRNKCLFRDLSSFHSKLRSALLRSRLLAP